MKKIPVGILAVSIILFLFPFMIKVLANMPIGWGEFFRSYWFSFLFFGILGIGILKINNKIRFVTVVITTAMAVSGPLGLIIGFFTVGYKIHVEIIKKQGISVILYPWLLIFPMCLLYASIAFYLTRPKVKEQFK